jgi:hypothetical protein
MSNEELLQRVLTLPLPDRVELAQALLKSINESSGPGVPDEEREAVEQAKRRDRELSTGEVVGRSHQEVLEAARRALRCD